MAISAGEVFSSLIPIEGRAFENGFSYDFISKERGDASLLPLISKQMQTLISQDISFDSMTMTPRNAASFLQSKQPIQAALLEGIDKTVIQLCKVGDFYDIYQDDLQDDFMEEPWLKSSSEICTCVVYEWINLDLVYPELGEVSVIRIRGAAFEDIKSARRFLKQVDEAKKNDPIEIMEKADFASFQEESVIWHPKGMAVRSALEAAWKEECIKRDFSFVSSSGKDAKRAHLHIFERSLQQGKELPYRLAEWHQQDRSIDPKDCDGLFVTKSVCGDSMHVLCDGKLLEKEIISSLQFMQEIARMIGLECHFVLVYSKTKGTDACVAAFSQLGISFEKRKCAAVRFGPRIELYTVDLRERKWPLSTASIDYDAPRKMKQGSGALVLLSMAMMLSCERFVALLLEGRDGMLPFWLASEQVRIFAVESSCMPWVCEIKDRLSKAGIRASIDMQSTNLATKIYEASQQNIPIGMVIGERELKNKVLNVRLLQERQQVTDVVCSSFIDELARCNQAYEMKIDIKKISQEGT